MAESKTIICVNCEKETTDVPTFDFGGYEGWCVKCRHEDIHMQYLFDLDRRRDEWLKLKTIE
jgi:hypothetical protein